MAKKSHKFELTSPKAFILLAKLIKNKIHLKGKKKHATEFHNIEMKGYKRILFLITLPTKHDSKSVFLSSPWLPTLQPLLESAVQPCDQETKRQTSQDCVVRTHCSS